MQEKNAINSLTRSVCRAVNLQFFFGAAHLAQEFTTFSVYAHPHHLSFPYYLLRTVFQQRIINKCITGFIFLCDSMII